MPGTLLKLLSRLHAQINALRSQHNSNCHMYKARLRDLMTCPNIAPKKTMVTYHFQLKVLWA